MCVCVCVCLGYSLNTDLLRKKWNLFRKNQMKSWGDLLKGGTAVFVPVNIPLGKHWVSAMMYYVPEETELRYVLCIWEDGMYVRGIREVYGRRYIRG